MSVSLDHSQTQPHLLPPITSDTIKRATEGVAYAQNPVIKQAIQEGLKNLETIAQGTFERRLHGGFRRLFLRSLIHTLFQVRVEYPEGIPGSPVILVANHLNHIDPFLLLSELPACPYFHILGDARTLYNKSQLFSEFLNHFFC